MHRFAVVLVLGIKILPLLHRVDVEHSSLLRLSSPHARIPPWSFDVHDSRASQQLVEDHNVVPTLRSLSSILGPLASVHPVVQSSSCLMPLIVFLVKYHHLFFSV